MARIVIQPKAKGEDFNASPYPCNMSITARVTGQHVISGLHAAYFAPGFAATTVATQQISAVDGANTLQLSNIGPGGQVVWIVVVTASGNTRMVLEVEIASDTSARKVYTYDAVVFANAGDVASVKDGVVPA